MAREGHSDECKSFIAMKAFHVSKMIIEENLLEDKTWSHDYLETAKDNIIRTCCKKILNDNMNKDEKNLQTLQNGLGEYAIISEDISEDIVENSTNHNNNNDSNGANVNPWINAQTTATNT